MRIIKRLKQRVQAVKRLMIKNKHYLLTIFVIGFLDDLFLNSQLSGYLVIGLVILWLIIASLYKLQAKQALVLAAGMFFLALSFQLIGKERMVEKLSSWMFIFLVMAIIHSLFEKKRGK